MLPGCIGMRPGSQAASAATAARPMALTTQKVERQPATWPSAVPSGTPSTLASVRPVNISAMALERWWRGTRSAATTAPMPKKAPWQKAVKTRAAISVP